MAARLKRYLDAENLLARCLEIAPNFAAADRNYATVLHRQHKNARALSVVDELLGGDSSNPTYRNLKAAILGGLGRYPESIDPNAALVEEFPDRADIWLNYGHALKTAGRRADSIAAYRRCIALAPQRGAPYWSLANLKTFRFDAADLEAMETQLRRVDLPDDERVQLHFAAGKAWEDANDVASAFNHYNRANQIRRQQISYCPERTTARVQRSRQLLTQAFFRERAGYGHPSRAPIFIVGLPRVGSTLLEQILASHSQVEGTMELPRLDFNCTVERFRERRFRVSEQPGSPERCGVPRTGSALPRSDACAAQDRRAVSYRQDAEQLRVRGIHSVDPAECENHRCASASDGVLSVHLQTALRAGPELRLSTCGPRQVLRDYVDLMSHFDDVLSGRVHRVHYESMVADTEGQVRALLEYCGLPFEAACLRFHENTRAVRTASSEQVRRPIYREALDSWRPFEPWLGPLAQGLGPALESYPMA